MKKLFAVLSLLVLSNLSFADEISTNNIYSIQVEAAGTSTGQLATIIYKDANNENSWVFLSYCSAGDQSFEWTATCIRNFDVYKTWLSILIAAKSTGQTVWINTTPGYYGAPAVTSVALGSPAPAE